ncbi:baseplate J/gp47 family protein [Pseudomonas quasicaspiana]|uniref:baseplate J/gp47 family protein n=1 Tax=Pseudomonas quasicaspiana TaxID=2829821 RepID=UPI001E5A3362|nr:baseplate J/gp47 family protein [Pseudomonas quasicaspiana]MCD5980521.1 baseplate J/gp47 family protein [Pseudomonas quasicaspiana]
MPFDTPTLPALIARAQGDLSGSSALLRSDAEVLARVLGAGAYGRYGHQSYIAQQILPDTADEETLRRMARARLKRDQLPAVAAQGPVGFIGSAGRVLDAGTLLQREDGQRFRVTLSVTLTAPDGVATVEAVTPGQLGNTPAGMTLRTVSPVLGVSDTFTVLAPGLTAGTEQEDLETLRARVIRSYRVVAHGGSKSDYETWALEVPGVTRAWVRRHWMGVGTVAVFIVRDGDIEPIPSVEALAQAYEYIENERPVTAELYVLAPAEKLVQYEIQLVPDSSATRAAVEAALIDLHNRESDLGVTLLLTHIREAISGATGEKDHQLFAPLGDVVPAANEFPTFGGILWR